MLCFKRVGNSVFSNIIIMAMLLCVFCVPLLAQGEDPGSATEVGGGSGGTEPPSGGGTPPPGTPGKKEINASTLEIVAGDITYRLVVTQGEASANQVETQTLTVAQINGVGFVEWSHRFSGAGLYPEGGIRTLVDDFGHILIAVQFSGELASDTGIALQSKGMRDIALFKLDAGGGTSWRRQVGGSGDFALADLELDETGAVYLYGSVTNTISFDPSMSELEEIRSFLMTLSERGGLRQIMFEE